MLKFKTNLLNLNTKNIKRSILPRDRSNSAQILRIDKKRANKNYANIKNTGGEIKYKGAKRTSETKT